MEIVTDLIFLGFQITADGDFSHEIKIHLLLGRKTVINLVQLLSCIWLFVTPWIAARQPSLSEKALAPHSSTLAWKISWTKESGGLQSMGWLRVGHDSATSLSLFTFMHWRRKWQPTPMSLPGDSQGRGSLLDCRLWGHNRVGHNWNDLAVAAVAGLPVHHKHPESTQTHVHWDSDANQPSHPLSSPSPSAPNPSQH